MRSHKRQPERPARPAADHAAGDDSRDSRDSGDAMERFRHLAGRLIRVPKEELKVAEERYLADKAGRKTRRKPQKS